MPALIAFNLFVAALVILDLVLTLGVIRRLRQHNAILTSFMTAKSTAIAPGSVLGDFSAETDDHEVVSNRSLRGKTLLGFFSEDCQGCTKALPGFVDLALAFPGGRQSVLAVILEGPGSQGAALGYRDALRPIARTIRERPGGQVSTALKVSAFPSYALVDSDGRVLASGGRLDTIKAALAA